MKKIISLILLLSLILTTISVSAYAVTLYAPDGRTISVHDYEVNTYKSLGWYDVPVCKIYSANNEALIVSKTDLDYYLNQGWKADYMVNLYSTDGRQTSVWLTEVQNYVALGWYTEPVCVIYSPVTYQSAVIYKSELQTYVNLGWVEDVDVILFSPNGDTIKVRKTQVQSYRNVGWYEVPVVRMYANGGKICVIASSEISQYRKVGWYPIYAYAVGNSANEIVSSFGTLLDYSGSFNTPIYLTNSTLGIDLGFVFNGTGSGKTVKSCFAYFKTVFPHLSILEAADGTISASALSAYFGTQLQYVNGAYSFVYDGYKFSLSVNTNGKVTMNSICVFSK